MTDCGRCDRSAEDGATIQSTRDGPRCVVCVDYLRERGQVTRHVDQAGLDGFGDS